MRCARWAGIVGAAVGLAAGTGCGAGRRLPASATAVADRDAEPGTTSRWHVVFAPVGGTTADGSAMDGWASMRSGTSRANTAILLNVAHAAPGTVHPWELHHGRCGADGGIFGPAAAYASLTVDSTGRGAAQATVRMPLPSQGPFFVRVAASPAAPTTTVACGDLVAPTP